jgi:hypothetical protein
LHEFFIAAIKAHITLAYTLLRILEWCHLLGLFSVVYLLKNHVTLRSHILKSVLDDRFVNVFVLFCQRLVAEVKLAYCRLLAPQLNVLVSILYELVYVLVKTACFVVLYWFESLGFRPIVSWVMVLESLFGHEHIVVQLFVKIVK